MSQFTSFNARCHLGREKIIINNLCGAVRLDSLSQCCKRVSCVRLAINIMEERSACHSPGVQSSGGDTFLLCGVEKAIGN
jgi:hypothetical protein